LSGVTAPVLIVQHIHHDFVAGLVDWLQRASALPVRVAEHGESPRAGHVYVGPAGVHLRIDAACHIELGPTPVTTHQPSADQLFSSLATNVGAGAVGVVLTGMGEDGASGLLALRRAGGHTIAQDEATSAVYGMPKAAERAGAVVELLPLDRIAAATARAVRKARA